MGQTTYDDRRRSTVPRTEKDAKFPHVLYPKKHLFKQVQVPLFWVVCQSNSVGTLAKKCRKSSKRIRRLKKVIDLNIIQCNR